MLIDKLRQITEEAEMVAKLVSHGKDGRQERLATRQRQADLNDLWMKYRAKTLTVEQLLDELVIALRINPRMTEADMQDTVDYDIYDNEY